MMKKGQYKNQKFRSIGILYQLNVLPARVHQTRRLVNTGQVERSYRQVLELIPDPISPGDLGNTPCCEVLTSEECDVGTLLRTLRRVMSGDVGLETITEPDIVAHPRRAPFRSDGALTEHSSRSTRPEAGVVDADKEFHLISIRIDF